MQWINISQTFLKFCLIAINLKLLIWETNVIVPKISWRQHWELYTRNLDHVFSIVRLPTPLKNSTVLTTYLYYSRETNVIEHSMAGSDNSNGGIAIEHQLELTNQNSCIKRREIIIFLLEPIRTPRWKLLQCNFHQRTAHLPQIQV